MQHLCFLSCLLVLQYFENKCNEELASQLQNNKEAWQGLRMTQRVRAGLKLRLQMIAPYIGTKYVNLISTSQNTSPLPACLVQKLGLRL